MLIKTILFGVIISLFISCSVQAQGFGEWTDPEPLTDSLSNNANAYLYHQWISGAERLFMVWEKETDSLSTAIYLKDILDSQPPQVVISNPGIKYSNPKIMDAHGHADSHILIIYESTENNNLDINYIPYSLSTGLGDPIALIDTPFDDTNYTIAPEWNFSKDNLGSHQNSISWISDSILFIKNFLEVGDTAYFSEVVYTDSSRCSQPYLEMGFWGPHCGLLYIKSDSNKHILMSAACNHAGEWSGPITRYDSSDNRNPNQALCYDSHKLWSTHMDSTWRVIVENDMWGNAYTIYPIKKDSPFKPVATGQSYGVKSFIPYLFVAVVYQDSISGMNEIFMTEYPGSTAFHSFTNSGTMNRNPQIFEGEHIYTSCWYHYIVWESYRNDHWQIWASKLINCVGNTDENNLDDFFISAYPNPFTHKTTLEFTLDSRSDVAIEVYDNRGIRVGTIANQSFDQGEHQLRWNSDGMPAGVYIIKMTVGDMIYTKKVVKSP